MYFFALLTWLMSMNRENIIAPGCWKYITEVTSIIESIRQQKGVTHIIIYRWGIIRLLIFFVSKNIFDCITINRIVDMYDGINPSNHSIIYNYYIILLFKFIMNVRIIKTALLLIAIVCGIRQALKILQTIIMH